MISLYVDSFGESIVSTIATLKTSLGITTVEQGDWARMPAPEDLDTVLPAVFVSFLRTEFPELRMHRIRVIYHYRVRIFRRQSDSDANPARSIIQMASTIWSTLANHHDALKLQDTLTPNFFTLSTPDGCVYESMHVNGPSLENADNEAMNLAELRCNVAWMDVQITATSNPYTPA